jgi:hypothetical protein
MKKPPVIPLPVPKTLTEQKSDFTAEGSPPPGKVLTTTPETAPEPGKPAAPPTQPGAGVDALPTSTRKDPA